jgi:hypothetical protein
MKLLRIYEIKMLDGTQYRGEIAYRDDKMLVLKLSHTPVQHRLRLFYNGIVSIRELGWKKAYAIR